MICYNPGFPGRLLGMPAVRKPTKKWDTVAIVGVGLIGGSIGRAVARRAVARRVVGIGRRGGSLARARRCGAIDTGTTNVARGVAEADLVVVCTPVEQIVDRVREAAAACRPGTIVTDAGSTKAEVVRQLGPEPASGVAFVGSHPLAGGEKTGPDHARDDLLTGRTVVVTPTRQTDPAAADAIECFWRQLGADVVRMTPAAHDEAVAATSHVPHLVASLLAGCTPEKLLPLVSTGWLDTTRLAAGDVELWRQILESNGPRVSKALTRFGRQVDAMRTALDEGDTNKILRLLEAGKSRRDAVGN